MENKKRLTAIIYFISSILAFITAVIGENYVFIPIGCCFIILGIAWSRKKMMIRLTGSIK